MRSIKILGASLLALTAVVATTAPANAHPRHQVCGWEHHHGHRVHVCHWR